MTKPHDYADDTDDGNDHKNDNDTGSTPDRTWNDPRQPLTLGFVTLYDFSCHAWVCLRPQKRSRQKILEDVLHCFSLERFLAQLHPPNDTILVLYLA